MVLGFSLTHVRMFSPTNFFTTVGGLYVRTLGNQKTTSEAIYWIFLAFLAFIGARFRKHTVSYIFCIENWKVINIDCTALYDSGRSKTSLEQTVNEANRCSAACMMTSGPSFTSFFLHECWHKICLSIKTARIYRSSFITFMSIR